MPSSDNKYKKIEAKKRKKDFKLYECPLSYENLTNFINVILNKE
jgi:hypothetical protein